MNSIRISNKKGLFQEKNQNRCMVIMEVLRIMNKSMKPHNQTSLNLQEVHKGSN